MRGPLLKILYFKGAPTRKASNLAWVRSPDCNGGASIWGAPAPSLRFIAPLFQQLVLPFSYAKQGGHPPWGTLLLVLLCFK